MSKKVKKETSVESGSGGGNVRRQFAPFYNVVAGGKTVEWTDKFSEADSAFKDAAARPKYIYKIWNASDISVVSAKV